MKKLLVFLLCAALLVPSVGMNAGVMQVQAATADETAKGYASELSNCYGGKGFSGDAEASAIKVMEEAADKLGLTFNSSTGKLTDNPDKETGFETETDVIEYVKSVKQQLDALKKESESSTSTSSESTSKAKEKADAEAKDQAVFLSDYYKNLKFTDAEKKAANQIMLDAADKLGLIFDASTGKLTDNPSVQTIFEYKANVTDYVNNEIKPSLDGCKTSSGDSSSNTSNTPSEPESITTNSNIIIGGKEYDTTIANAGQHCEIAVPLVNLGDTTVTNVVITPALSSDAASWPFEISRTDYSQVCEELKGENSGLSVLDRKCTFRWTLKTRDDAITGYTKLVFNVTYNEEDGTQKTVALDYYVQVNGVAPKEEGGKISTPRVIVTGFTTTPEEVYAGDTFKLTLNLKNTSKKTAVSNMLFDIQGTQEGKDADSTYAAFLPTAGSSTIFVDSIAANSSKSITIELKSKADLSQKPYVVTVNMEYEDSDANPYTETASVSVPIKQEPKVDISSITLMPESVDIGNEANVMFSIYNVGKTKLYNVNVKFEADSISGGDTFIGNMDPGATGNVDAYVTAQAATMDDGTVKILITYENEEGKEETIEKTMTLFVSEPYYPDMMEDPMMMEGMEEEKAGFPWWGIVLIVLAVIIAAVVAVVVMKKKKRAKLQAQEELEVIEMLEDNQSEEK